MHSSDFQRMLAKRAQLQSAHFAIHHEPRLPDVGGSTDRAVEATDLSTAPADKRHRSVDKVCFGAVLPKRHARRAVTRNLLRRQIRSAMQRHADRLPRGLWVVRLRRPFAGTDYVAAASDALRGCVRVELDAMLQRAIRP